MTYSEVADTLEAFLEGRGGDWDWDNYISATFFSDPHLREVQSRMDGLSNEFPAPRGKGYCSEEGCAVIRGYVEELRKPLRTGDPTTMSQKKQGIKAKFTSVAAHLFVRDLQASMDFLTAQLGFGVDFVYGEPPFYGEVSRDNARLALRFVEVDVFAEGVREREDFLSASITLGNAEEIEELFLGYQAAGVRFHQVLRREPWGAKTFVVRDPDGNLILFAGPAR